MREGLKKVAVYRDDAGGDPQVLGRLHAPGVHRAVEPRREDLGLPLSRQPVRSRWAKCVMGPAIDDLSRSTNDRRQPPPLSFPVWAFELDPRGQYAQRSACPASHRTRRPRLQPPPEPQVPPPRPLHQRPPDRCPSAGGGSAGARAGSTACRGTTSPGTAAPPASPRAAAARSSRARTAAR